MFAVDTNILVYAANQDSPESQACSRVLEEWVNGSEPWFLSWGIIYEFLRVVTHPRMQQPLPVLDAWAFIDDLVASSSLRILEPTARHHLMLRQVLEDLPDLAGNLLFDVRTAVLMREHGITRIMTHDRDFRRFPFIQAVDPLAL